MQPLHFVLEPAHLGAHPVQLELGIGGGNPAVRGGALGRGASTLVHLTGPGPSKRTTRPATSKLRRALSTNFVWVISERATSSAVIGPGAWYSMVRTLSSK